MRSLMCSHHREVVGDEQDTRCRAVLQVLHQVHHLRLDRDVERRHRLVGDHQSRLGGESARDADALALPARELVWIAERLIGGEPDFLEQPRHALGALVGAQVGTMHRERLGHDVAQRPAWIERRVGVLVDHLDLGADRSHGPAIERHQVDVLTRATAKVDRARGHLDQAQDALGDGGLAASRLADQSQRLALLDGERDTVDRLDLTRAPQQDAAVDRDSGWRGP